MVVEIARAFSAETAAAIAVGLPWFAMVGTKEFATDRAAARAVATTVSVVVEVP